MKKMLVLTVTALVLSLVFAGCSGKLVNVPDTDSETASVSRMTESKPIKSVAEDSTSSFLAGKGSDTAKSGKTGNSNSSVANSTTPKTEHSTPAAEKQVPRTAEKSAPRQETTKPFVAEQPKPEVTTPPQTETPQATVPSPEPTPQETMPSPEPIPPAPTEPPAPAFEVGGYVEQAKSYGQSIGLSLDSTATACWDNPTYASATASNISGNLSSLLDWYKDSGFTGFWVWAEDLGNGAYNIYIGYA